MQVDDYLLHLISVALALSLPAAGFSVRCERLSFHFQHGTTLDSCLPALSRPASCFVVASASRFRNWPMSSPQSCSFALSSACNVCRNSHGDPQPYRHVHHCRPALSSSIFGCNARLQRSCTGFLKLKLLQRRHVYCWSKSVIWFAFLRSYSLNAPQSFFAKRKP